jgi:hypothetical protein
MDVRVTSTLSWRVGAKLPPGSPPGRSMILLCDIQFGVVSHAYAW